MVNKIFEINYELYAQYVVEEKGLWFMYVELLKELYGTLRAVRLFWEQPRSKLINKCKFIPNKYDSCIVSKCVSGKDLRVMWYVDDLKVSPLQEKVVVDFNSQLTIG